MTTALVVAEPRPEADWTKERIETVKRSICPKGISDADFALFIEKCRRSGLDPFQNEIFCVPRRVNIGSKQNPQWATKHEAQAAADGMMARADRFPDFRGLKGAAYYQGEDITITEDGVKHAFNPTKRTGVPLGAWAQPFREGRVYPVEHLKFEHYRQQTSMWDKLPESMIVKCARAAALRRAYPNAFGGLYAREEMQAKDEPTETQDADGEQRPPRARGLDAIPTAITEVQEAKPALPAKGSSSFTQMDTEDLREAIIKAEAWLEKPHKAETKAKAETKLQALKDELAKREEEAQEPPPHNDTDAVFFGGDTA